MTNTVAVWLRTESGDNYLFLETDVVNNKDIVDRIEKEMGDELAYVYDWEIEIRGDLVRSSLSNAISNRRNDLLDDAHA